MFYTHKAYMSICQLRRISPCRAPFCFYFWIDNCTDHLNILHLHGLHLRELLNCLVFWLVHHARYRNRIHPLGTLFFKCWKLVFLLSSQGISSESSSLFSVRPTFVTKRDFQGKHQLREYRHHMQKYPLSCPFQSQQDLVLKSRFFACLV